VIITDMPTFYKNILREEERKILRDYIDIDDERSDFRPDVRSKHPRWNDTNWPKDSLNDALLRIMPRGFEIEEITFRNDKIAVKPHTDNGSIKGTKGKTVMFLLDYTPEAHTITFKNYWTGWAPLGVFFTKNKWSPFTYKLPNKNNEYVEVKDIRILHKQCEENPSDVKDFNVNKDFIQQLGNLISKRSLDRLAFEEQNKDTGYIQPGPRINDYQSLTHYQQSKKFDSQIHQKYLNHIDINDLHGLEIDKIFQWEERACIIFDREQLHCSSSCHKEKSFVTIFCHEN
jgi:hypothetical protein